MSSSIRVVTGFQSSRARRVGAADNALPHHHSYLGVVLGLIATVVVALAGIGYWLVQSGVVYIQINI